MSFDEDRCPSIGGLEPPAAQLNTSSLAQHLLLRQEELRRKRQDRELLQKHLQAAKTVQAANVDLMALFTECKRNGSVISPVSSPRLAVSSPIAAAAHPERMVSAHHSDGERIQHPDHLRSSVSYPDPSKLSSNVQDAFQRLLLDHTALSPEYVCKNSPPYGSEKVFKESPPNESLESSFNVVSLGRGDDGAPASAKKTSTLSRARQARLKIIAPPETQPHIDSKRPNFPPKSIFGESQPGKTTGKLTIPKIEQSLRGGGVVKQTISKMLRSSKSSITTP